MTKTESQRLWHQANKERRNREARERYRVKRAEILQQQAAYKRANRDKIQEQAHAYYAANSETIKAKSRERYAARRDEKLAALRAYRERPEYAAEQAARQREWRDGHRAELAEYEALRRARKRGVPAERVRREILWNRDDGICHICGTLADASYWHVDHVVPLSRGGAHSYSNTAVSHPECNLIKGCTDPRDAGSPYAYLLERLDVAEAN